MSATEVTSMSAVAAPATTPALTPVLVHLLKGVLYRDSDEQLW
jgi:hypothetical protein